LFDLLFLILKVLSLLYLYRTKECSSTAILSSDLFKEALATLPTLLLIKKSYLEPLILSLKNSNLSSYSYYSIVKLISLLLILRSYLRDHIL